jgi:hypothetical protein
VTLGDVGRLAPAQSPGCVLQRSTATCKDMRGIARRRRAVAVAGGAVGRDRPQLAAIREMVLQRRARGLLFALLGRPSGMG